MLNWLVDNLNEKWPKITRLDVLEKTHEIQRRVMSSEELLDIMTREEVEDIILKLREVRCLGKNKLLSYQYELNDIGGKTVLTSLADVLFHIELLLTFTVRLEKWNEAVENDTVTTWEDIIGKPQPGTLVIKPEAEIVRTPMSQLLANLKLLTLENGCSKFKVGDVDQIIYHLHERVSIFLNTELPEDDMDIEDYRIVVPKDENSAVDEEGVDVPLYHTNHLFLAEMRHYLDTLFQNSILWKRQQTYIEQEPVEIAGPRVQVEDIERYLVEKCKSFEREHFLENFTDYVLEMKLQSKLMHNLYRQKFPDVTKPDARRIVTHFRGAGAIVDYTSFRYIVDIFGQVEHAYEFSLLFYLLMIHKENPMSTENKHGYVMRNPLNSDEFTYYNCKTEKCTRYGSFLTAISACFNAGHSKAKIIDNENRPYLQ